METINELHATADAFREREGRDATPMELASLLELPLEKLEKLLKISPA